MNDFLLFDTLSQYYSPSGFEHCDIYMHKNVTEARLTLLQEQNSFQRNFIRD